MSILIISLLATLSVSLAQATPDFKIGIHAGYNLNYHTIDFGELSNTPQCNSCLESRGGSGISIGANLDLPLLNSLFLSVKLGYNMLDGYFQNETSMPIVQNGIPTIAIIGKNIDSKIRSAYFEPTLSFRIAEGLHADAGLRLGYLVKSNFTSEEKLISPINATFENGMRVRNATGGEIPDANDLQAGLVAGLSYEFVISDAGDIALVPYGTFYYGVTNIAKGSNWELNSLQFGLSFKYLIGWPGSLLNQGNP